MQIKKTRWTQELVYKEVDKIIEESKKKGKGKSKIYTKTEIWSKCPFNKDIFYSYLLTPTKIQQLEEKGSYKVTAEMQVKIDKFNEIQDFIDSNRGSVEGAKVREFLESENPMLQKLGFLLIARKKNRKIVYGVDKENRENRLNREALPADVLGKLKGMNAETLIKVVEIAQAIETGAR